MTIQVVADYDVKEVGQVTKVWRKIKGFFKGISDGISGFFGGIFDGIKNFFHPTEESHTN